MKLSVLIIGFLFMTLAIAAPPKKPGLVTVTEVVAQKMREEIPLSGTAEALQESALSPRLSGVVKEVFVEEGKRVEAGDKISSETAREALKKRVADNSFRNQQGNNSNRQCGIVLICTEREHYENIDKSMEWRSICRKSRSRTGCHTAHLTSVISRIRRFSTKSFSDITRNSGM